MRLMGPAALACGGILLVAGACSSFQGVPADPSEAGGPGAEGAADAAPADGAFVDGARPVFTCSGALFCEEFDNVPDVGNLMGNRSQNNASHALVGARGTPERHLEVSVQGKQAGDNERSDHQQVVDQVRHLRDLDGRHDLAAEERRAVRVSTTNSTTATCTASSSPCREVS